MEDKVSNISNNSGSGAKASGRSVAYPSMDLEKATVSVSGLIEKFGRGPYSREDAAKGLGYSGISGASARAVAALVHYGLLDRSGNTYVISTLTDDILNPTDETGIQAAEAVRCAARSPKLFDKLVRRFQNQALPTLLENIIMREGVNDKVAKEVASIFKATLIHAGLLQNGVVVTEPVQTKGSVNDDVTQSEEQEDAEEEEILSKQQKVGSYAFSESGDGWSLVIKSEAAMRSEMKKLLIDVTEQLQNANTDDEE